MLFQDVAMLLIMASGVDNVQQTIHYSALFSMNTHLAMPVNLLQSRDYVGLMRSLKADSMPSESGTSVARRGVGKQMPEAQHTAVLYSAPEHHS